jgi:hypothetical protein
MGEKDTCCQLPANEAGGKEQGAWSMENGKKTLFVMRYSLLVTRWKSETGNSGRIITLSWQTNRPENLRRPSQSHGNSLADREGPAVSEFPDSFRPDVGFRLGHQPAQKIFRVKKDEAFKSNVKEKGVVIPKVGNHFFTG